MKLNHREESQNEVLFTFPPEGRQYASAKITCFGMSTEFLVYGDRSGIISYYYLSDGGPLIVNEFCHTNRRISRIWLNSSGSRVIFEDDLHQLHLYNPVNDQILSVPEFKGSIETVLWDGSDSRIFLVAQSSQNFIYLYSPLTVYGPKLVFLGEFIQPEGFTSLSLSDGIFKCQKNVRGKDELKQRFHEHLARCHFQEAWKDALVLESPEIWEILTKKAIEQMDVDMAIKSSRLAKNATMLMYLEQLENVENYHLLSGNLLLLLGEPDDAERSFLRSCDPEAAIEMRRNMQQYDKALDLAVKLKSAALKEVKKEYAQHLEWSGNHQKALMYYEDLMKENINLSVIQGGIARCSIYAGDPWKGRKMALQCADPILYAECAEIFESLTLLQDAAEFYELGCKLDKAASLYIRLKEYAKALPLLEDLSNPKLFVEYAKALEGDGSFNEAATAYELAEDVENLIRLLLGSLENSSKAFSTVHKTKSAGGAFLAARYCKNIGDYEKAIEFLIMANRFEEAKELAQQYNKMDIYTDLVIDLSSKDEGLQLARYYETMGEYIKGGIILERFGEFHMALKLYIQSATEEALEKAIIMVSRSKDERLINQFLDYLKSEKDDRKRFYHMYKLHEALGQYDEAIKVATLLATQEQEAGNYRKAHQFLFNLSVFLRNQGHEIPVDNLKQLMLLHSYILVKIQIKLDNHISSARLLIRVSEQISKFPAHAVPILTSTVIECYRSGLKTAAFEYALVLMRPEYRNSISITYRRKVEKIVRKCERGDVMEASSPCPMCGEKLPVMKLDCDSCKNSIPFCIASGQHMTSFNSTTCPNCKFPAITSEFMKILKSESLCPMCLKEIHLEDLSSTDIKSDL